MEAVDPPPPPKTRSSRLMKVEKPRPLKRVHTTTGTTLETSATTGTTLETSATTGTTLETSAAGDQASIDSRLADVAALVSAEKEKKPGTKVSDMEAVDPPPPPKTRSSRLMKVEKPRPLKRVHSNTGTALETSAAGDQAFIDRRLADSAALLCAEKENGSEPKKSGLSSRKMLASRPGRLEKPRPLRTQPSATQTPDTLKSEETLATAGAIDRSLLGQGDRDARLTLPQKNEDTAGLDSCSKPRVDSQISVDSGYSEGDWKSYSRQGSLLLSLDEEDVPAQEWDGQENPLSETESTPKNTASCILSSNTTPQTTVDICGRWSSENWDEQLLSSSDDDYEMECLRRLSSSLTYREHKELESSSSATNCTETDDRESTDTQDEGFNEQEYAWKLIEDLTDRVQTWSIRNGPDTDSSREGSVDRFSVQHPAGEPSVKPVLKKCVFSIPSAVPVLDPILRHSTTDNNNNRTEIDKDFGLEASSFLREEVKESASVRRNSYSRQMWAKNVCVVREPISPFTQLEEIWAIEQEHPAGLHSVKGRRRMFRSVASCRQEELVSGQSGAPRITYTVEELLKLGASPASQCQPESWLYKTHILPEVCLKQVSTFLDTENLLERWQYVVERSWMAQTQRRQDAWSNRSHQYREETCSKPALGAKSAAMWAGASTAKPAVTPRLGFGNGPTSCQSDGAGVSGVGGNKEVNLNSKCDVRVRNNDVVAAASQLQGVRLGFHSMTENSRDIQGPKAKPVGRGGFLFGSQEKVGQVFQFGSTTGNQMDTQTGSLSGFQLQPFSSQEKHSYEDQVHLDGGCDKFVFPNPMLPQQCPW